MTRPTRLLPSIVLLACLALSVGMSAPAQRARSYRNPVIDSDFPDPSVLRAPDGFYYLYATQGGAGGHMLNIQLARSRDLVRWTRIGDALPVKPGWASRTQDFWAPHVVRHGGTYYLYYSAKPDAALTDTSRGLCLAVATARRPEGPFTDSGQPLQCGQGFVNIDPMAFDDPATGRRLLYWGSGFGPIHVRELAPDRVSFAADSRAVDLVAPDPTDDPGNYRRLVEGAWVIRRAGWYYLFFSGDNCCGPDAHYAVLVARSRLATGPFTVRRDPVSGLALPVVARSAAWIAPGHNAVIADAAGRLWMLYHGVDAARPRSRPSDQVNTRRVMLLDPLTFVDGWPTVAGGTPSSRSQSAPQTSPR
ncbi:glycoside hydrolase family 43 protein [Sphingomonas sp.]|jgi:arabinan endo-1,5-alpha-L-arabinosidase|uniref:glycoside hydrolase family 43 protein n=1 Tax=Sphingomonas sp. TaxID=28214 RepID=UPI002E3251C8|nr:glycoside hydrolase family 43 protein [Sphingomonas sp.]HEX4694672.1 glycoside hydrolase family 43 protein [Sphingomonas sp.]